MPLGRRTCTVVVTELAVEAAWASCRRTATVVTEWAVEVAVSFFRCRDDTKRTYGAV